MLSLHSRRTVRQDGDDRQSQSSYGIIKSSENRFLGRVRYLARHELHVLECRHVVCRIRMDMREDAYD